MSSKPAFLRGRGRGRGGRGTAPTHNSAAVAEPSVGSVPAGKNWAQKVTPQHPGSNIQKVTSDVHRRHDQNSRSSAEERFQDAAKKHQVALQQHMKDADGEYASSSEEDEMNEDIMTAVLKSYHCDSAGDGEMVYTNEYLTNSVKSKANTCLICIETVKRTDAVWSCRGCFTLMHITCIQKWVKDGVYQQTALSQENFPERDLPWFCPKCRHEYRQSDCPTRYFCFCRKVQDPEFDPWLLPHSCGQVCGQLLRPDCGHRCLLLCHPGPCPPCPKTVSVTCHCGRSAPTARRCGDPDWSCGHKCQRPLQCQQHNCQKKCHKGDCPVCPETSLQACQCGNEINKCPCASPKWQCQKVCGRALSCGQHFCQVICHAGDCGPCPRSGQRRCPCGTTSVTLPCTEDVPTCLETCGKPLQCGIHTCTQRCHTQPCGTCHQMAVKRCRCGQKQKEVPCYKPFLCETRCTRTRNCGRHPCKRKCCDQTCPDCELTCGRPLACRNHKCVSVCHQGPCYPCPLTVTISCRCGLTSITVACGVERRTKPPRCKALCKIPAECHHVTQTPHRCHPGRCPPCRQTCAKRLPNCSHMCPVECHSAVLTKIHTNVTRAGPWEALPEAELRVLNKPCPPCLVPTPVQCFGKHQTDKLACHEARPFSCMRSCGRLLTCTNHTCELTCHLVMNPVDDIHAGETCSTCERVCMLPRPAGCTHACSLPCHHAPCPPCTLPLRMRCHCTLTVRHIDCDEWTHADEKTKERLQACGGPCPRQLPCGHPCKSTCHPGPCANSNNCNDRVKVRCPCRRRKQDFLCSELQAGIAKVECDDVCERQKEAKLKNIESSERAKREKEEKEQREEYERFERKMNPRSRRKDRSQNKQNATSSSFLSAPIRYGLLVVILAAFAAYLLWH